MPDKLTIAFVLWALFDTAGKTAKYHDIDKMVREHVERGFNCIRIDCGAGLTHDLNGNPRGEIDIDSCYGEYDNTLRQFGVYGDGGKCDVLSRLIALCESAKKHGVYLILSSWYYLHTFWCHPANDSICKELFDIPPHDRFMVFAKLHHYILTELEKRQLDDCVAFIEIFNEADGLRFVNGYGNENDLSEEEIYSFRQDHENAIAWLKERHSKMLFAFDSYSPWADARQMPRNMDVYNFHGYYMWGIYDDVLRNHPELLSGTATAEDVAATRSGRLPSTNDWYDRAAVYSNLDSQKLPEFERLLEEQLQNNFDRYLSETDDYLQKALENVKPFPNVRIVFGEGVSYIGSKALVWEEKSEKYWSLVEKATRKFSEAGFWGSVVRTCCGPEDPCWDMCKEQLKRVNSVFLEK